MKKINNTEERKNCPMRHDNGNCMPLGGFCLDAVDDELCHAMHNAYAHGRLDERLQKKVENASAEDIVTTIKEIVHMCNGSDGN